MQGRARQVQDRKPGGRRGGPPVRLRRPAGRPNNSSAGRRKATTTASSSTGSTAARGSVGPAGRSATALRFVHSATVFGLIPWRLASVLKLAWPCRIARRSAFVVVALPWRTMTHRASLPAQDKTAPSNPGIKQLVRRHSRLRSKGPASRRSVSPIGNADRPSANGSTRGVDGVRRQFGGFAKDATGGRAVRHDHRSQHIAHDLQKGAALPGHRELSGLRPGTATSAPLPSHRKIGPWPRAAPSAARLPRDCDATRPIERHGCKRSNRVQAGQFNRMPTAE